METDKNKKDKKYGRRCVPWYNEKGEIVGTMMVVVDLEEEKKKAKQKTTTGGYDDQVYKLD